MTKTIFTATINDLPYMRIGLANIRAYAEKIGAEVVVTEETSYAQPQFALFDCFKKATEKEGRYLWIDADILIDVDAPDLFELDEELVWSCTRQRRTGGHYQKYWIPFLTERGLLGKMEAKPYLTTGLVAFSSEQARRMLEFDEEWAPDYGDQEPFNYMWKKAGLEVGVINRKIHGPPKSKHKPPFIHCGGGNKIKKMKAVSTEREVFSKT